MMQETYTLDIKPVGNHLQVHIPELQITVETTGTTRDEALAVAHRAIIAALRKSRKPRSVKASRD